VVVAATGLEVLFSTGKKDTTLSKLELWTWTPSSDAHAGLLPWCFLPCGKETW